MPSRWKRSQRHAQVGHSYAMEQVTPLPAWEDETSFLKSSTASPLASLEGDSSLCPTGDFVTCRAASASEQPTLANGSPEESPGFPTALTVTAIVLHGNKKQSSRSELSFGLFPGLCLPLSSPGWTRFPEGLRWPLGSRRCWGAARPSAPHGHPQAGQEHPLLPEPASALTLT